MIYAAGIGKAAGAEAAGSAQLSDGHTVLPPQQEGARCHCRKAAWYADDSVSSTPASFVFKMLYGILPRRGVRGSAYWQARIDAVRTGICRLNSGDAATSLSFGISSSPAVHPLRQVNTATCRVAAQPRYIREAAS